MQETPGNGAKEACRNCERCALERQIQKIGDFQIVSEIFRQLSDPTRVRIYWILCHREECVMGVAEMLGMSSPAVSHHLRPLKNSGLITARREGRVVFYRASETEEAKLLHTLIEKVMQIACPN